MAVVEGGVEVVVEGSGTSWLWGWFVGCQKEYGRLRMKKRVKRVVFGFWWNFEGDEPSLKSKKML
jgi:hypothetical protein